MLTGAAACFQLTGVQDFTKGACEGPCPDAKTDAPGDAAGDLAETADTGGCPAGMVAFAGGTYTPLGSGGGSVRIDALCVDPSEVTEAAYRKCVTDGACVAPATKVFCNYGLPERGDDPINCVDVTQAKTYCTTRDARLPTEDEWEWVARGGALAFLYPWGNTPPKATDSPEFLCWQGKTKHDDTGLWSTRPSGTCAIKGFPAGAREGIYDLAGNVWEWTSTPGDATTFVFRGGSAFDPADVANYQVGARKAAPSAGYPGVGFRCFKTLGG